MTTFVPNSVPFNGTTLYPICPPKVHISTLRVHFTTLKYRVPHTQNITVPLGVQQLSLPLKGLKGVGYTKMSF